ncbi:F-box protein PP2-A12 [Amaranthus tricolor]|uniref:F-box protein PP2-A12 n=1 Tax=Amaranthus tricolor TaxID=29722 RepID=UPI002588D2AE|nr:F-box protein PP2-A12 [Amaranthus tricolor]
MGSALAKESGNGSITQEKKTCLGDLPESCVALILMNLDPKDICNFARLNKAFQGASSADFVWDSKLPSNYQQIIENIFEENDRPVNSCKKEIYASLSRFNSMDDGTKKVWLDKATGGICMAISAKGLSITGIDDRRYWTHIPTEESRFSTIAYLQQIWWFEVNGEVEFPFPEGTYSVFFRVQMGRTFKKFGRRLCNTEQIHGWDVKPTHFQLSTSEGQRTVSQCFLEEPGQWLHYHAGDFVVKNSRVQTQLKFSMMQIDCTHTKGGICVDSVVIYPSSFKDRLKRL